MDCPRCRRALVAADAAAPFHLCPLGEGLLLDALEVERHLDDARRDALLRGLDGAAGSGACPRCAEPMRAVRAGGEPVVTLDVCLSCLGVWFDATQLDRLQDAGYSPRSDYSGPDPVVALGVAALKLVVDETLGA